MSLRLRLTLTLALALLLMVLSLGAALYFTAARELRQGFGLQLRTLARGYAQLALGAEQVRLREPPATPLRDSLGAVTAYLLEPNGRVADALGEAERDFVLPDGVMARAAPGQEVAFDLLGDARGGAAFPIFSSSDDFKLAYLLVVTANDLAGRRTLSQLRNSILIWSGLAALMALVVGDRLAAWLLRPMRQIAQTAAAIGRGDLTQRIQTADARDEIGALKRDLNTMLERLEQLVSAQQRFAAEAAHDLRTPLTVLRSELEIALRRPREAEAYQGVLERALAQTKTLGALAEDLLTLTKLEAGLERLEVLSLREALQPTLETYAQAALHSGATFEISVPEDLELRGDSVALNRLFANLLANALRVCQSRFGLRAQVVDQTIVFRVWDDGTGVPLEQREHLFTRFKSGTQSTGLGLAIALKAAKAHGGSIELETKTENDSGSASHGHTGAVFRVTLPISGSNLRLTQEK
jgi:two-component system, OmpR family, sensor kinase